MTLKINKNYLVYTKIAFLILLDAFAMCFIKNNITLFVFHSIANIIALSIICVKKNKEDCIIFSILFMLLYTFFIDVFIHYFHFNIIFETEYLYCIPLLFSVFKTKNINSKFFVFVAFSYIVLNALFVIINQKVDAWNYFIFLPYILTFVFFYYLFNNLELTNKFSIPSIGLNASKTNL